MHSVQPEHIDIQVASESALAWVQTHWGQASRLQLTWDRRDVPWVMAHNAASLTSLKRLEVSLLEERMPTTAMLLTWLLAQAPQLELLYLHHPRVFVVPPIRNLRHLIMESGDYMATSVASIRQLRNLQTLSLGRAGPDLEVECAEFDLACLPQLSDVCIDSLVVHRVNLPKDCRLHLVGPECDMFLTTWNDIARRGQLQSVNLQSSGLDEPFLDSIPELLLDWNCSVLNWSDMTQLGEVSNPVRFDFCRLTHLRLDGGDIHIVLPQELPLQVLHVEAMSLSIVCEDPHEQAERLQQVRVVYRTLQGTDISVLVGAMCGMGAIVSKVDGLEARADPDGRHGLLVSYQREPVLWKCPCGACLHCLQEI
ncbi:hypothetical protein COCOBI_14-4230 [Coccomyxa sp. Obi]|nr:hypothetical protein COCOBI_14-4230 [Coccomyxa sp. Obi]